MFHSEKIICLILSLLLKIKNNTTDYQKHNIILINLLESFYINVCQYIKMLAYYLIILGSAQKKKKLTFTDYFISTNPKDLWNILLCFKIHKFKRLNYIFAQWKRKNFKNQFKKSVIDPFVINCTLYFCILYYTFLRISNYVTIIIILKQKKILYYPKQIWMLLI